VVPALGHGDELPPDGDAPVDRVAAAVTEGQLVRGKLVPDAHLAAILIQNDVDTLYTNDRDFAKFSGFTVKNPLAG
jgi:predicted nucleic acid-binding protein